MVAWAPWAVPGLVMSLGFLWAFVWLPIYGTLWVLVLVFVARGLPVGSRFFTATMVQIGAELEESARIHGASWLRTFARIWIPLLRPAILGAWILLFVIAVRVLDLAVLLAGPGSRMLSVDIFFWTVTGRQEAASVLALLQTALVLVGYAGAAGSSAAPRARARSDRTRSRARRGLDDRGPRVLHPKFADMTPGGAGGEGALPTEHAPSRGGRRRRHRATASTALGFARAQKTRRGEPPLAPSPPYGSSPKLWFRTYGEPGARRRFTGLSPRLESITYFLILGRTRSIASMYRRVRVTSGALAYSVKSSRKRVLFPMASATRCSL